MAIEKAYLLEHFEYSTETGKGIIINGFKEEYYDLDEGGSLVPDQLEEIVIEPSYIVDNEEIIVYKIAKGALSQVNSENDPCLKRIVLPFVGGYESTNTDNSTRYFAYVFGADSSTSQAGYVPSSLKYVAIKNTKPQIIAGNSFRGNFLIETFDLSELPISSIGNYAFYNPQASFKRTIMLSSSFSGQGPKNFSKMAFQYHNAQILIKDNTVSWKLDEHNMNTNNGATGLNGDFGDGFVYLLSESVPTIEYKNDYWKEVSDNYKPYYLWPKYTYEEEGTDIKLVKLINTRGHTSLEIPNFVKLIGANAFSNSAPVRQITIPLTISKILDNAFSGSSDLQKIYISDLDRWLDIDFSTPGSNPLSLPCELYLNGNKVTVLEIPKSRKVIKRFSFYGCSSIESIVLNDVEEIGQSAFRECKNLKGVVSKRMDSIRIEDYCFYNCPQLKKVVCNGQLSHIGTYAFSSCISLENIECLGISGLLSYAFQNCKQLKEIKFSDKIFQIPQYAFHNCVKLTNITIPEQITKIGNCAFSGCSGVSVLRFLASDMSALNSGTNYSTRVFENLGWDTSGVTLYIGEKVRYIPRYLFGVDSSQPGSPKITYVDFISKIYAENRLKIDKQAFKLCKTIRQVTIHNLEYWCNIIFNSESNPLQYGAELMLDGKKLEHLVIPERLAPEVEDLAGSQNLSRTFTGCTSLVSVVIPKGTSVAYGCFNGCVNLEQITLLEDSYMYGKTFDQCTKLREVKTLGADVGQDRPFMGLTQPINFIYFGTDEQIAKSLENYPYGASEESTQHFANGDKDSSPGLGTDFIGFTFNKKHSIRDMGIYRVSNSNRYDSNISIDTNNKTAEASGIDGVYYFGTRHKSKKIPINIAFDNLTEEKLREWQNFCLGKEISQLILDEEPYKVYDAKITGAPSMKVICFDDENGQRVYKGEGTLEFTCYWPYARTPDEREHYLEYVIGDGKHLYNYWHATLDQWKEASGLTDGSSDRYENPGDIPSPFIVKADLVEKDIELKVGNYRVTLNNDYQYVEWNSETGIVSAVIDGKKQAIPYTGNSFGTIPVGGLAKDQVDLPDGAELKYNYWYY